MHEGRTAALADAGNDAMTVRALLQRSTLLANTDRHNFYRNSD